MGWYNEVFLCIIGGYCGDINIATILRLYSHYNWLMCRGLFRHYNDLCIGAYIIFTMGRFGGVYTVITMEGMEATIKTHNGLL
jgi:hypothetical protein